MLRRRASASDPGKPWHMRPQLPRRPGAGRRQPNGIVVVPGGRSYALHLAGSTSQAPSPGRRTWMTGWTNPDRGGDEASDPGRLFDQSAAQRFCHGRGAVRRPQLLEDVFEMGLDRVGRDVEPLGDVAVGVAEG